MEADNGIVLSLSIHSTLDFCSSVQEVVTVDATAENHLFNLITALNVWRRYRMDDVTGAFARVSQAIIHRLSVQFKTVSVGHAVISSVLEQQNTLT